MNYSRRLEMSPEDVVTRIQSRCNCNMTLFRMVEMSFLPPKEYGIFCVSSKNCLFFTINVPKTFGFNAPKRHFKIKLSGNNGQTLLTGRFYFSDFIVWLLAAILFSIAAGIKSHFERPQYLIVFIVGFIGIWAIQCVIGSIVFRKEEKLLIEKIDDLLGQICKETKRAD